MDTTNKPEFLTIKEAAQISGISTRTIRRKTASGEIPYYKFCAHIRIKYEDLMRAIEATRVTNPAPAGVQL